MTTSLPRRDDAFATWLKQQRDDYDPAGSRWKALDDVLDRYRLHADTRTPLDRHCCEGGTVDDCYGCHQQAQKPAPGPLAEVVLEEARMVARMFSGTPAADLAAALTAEVDRLRAGLAEMTRCRDNALRALNRDDVPTDPHLPDLFADGLHGLFEWPNQPEPDAAPDTLVNRCVALAQPVIGKLTQERDAARAELAAVRGQYANATRTVGGVL